MNIRPKDAESFPADIRTDMTKLKVVFRNFANAPRGSKITKYLISVSRFLWRMMGMKWRVMDMRWRYASATVVLLSKELMILFILKT